MASKRLKDIVSHLTSSNNASQEKPIPKFDELPWYKNYPGCAWGVWGPDDELGTVNLLTDEVVRRASQEEIKLGRAVSLNWPINFPEHPVFNRKTPEVNMLIRSEENGMPRDDEIHMNSQSGSQWDGLRHYGIAEHKVFYNKPKPCKNRHTEYVTQCSCLDNLQPPSLDWANHGICGRGVLLDIVAHHTRNGGKLPYDPWTSHPFTVNDLMEVAKAQSVTFRRGDILLLRIGFIQKYYAVTTEERNDLRGKPETFAGIEQSEDMKRFLWNNHFAAIASDQPTLERWPAPPGTILHPTILGLWGMPLGEFFDLEKLSETCAETGRYTFFFSSWPLNIIGGAASPPNAAVRTVSFLVGMIRYRSSDVHL
ncbi:hypothetical protein CVT24_006126 [Panaeolus cyanescens]|uniref:Cyclase n=1 Tax=Panaeolus cyanescens TaxID=181874 RepID=A0A409YDQ8_9AGAR|nr:hypothetical protein CVT24_006126 [Panaeolus cyanescens]